MPSVGYVQLGCRTHIHLCFAVVFLGSDDNSHPACSPKTSAKQACGCDRIVELRVGSRLVRSRRCSGIDGSENAAATNMLVIIVLGSICSRSNRGNRYFSKPKRGPRHVPKRSSTAFEKPTGSWPSRPSRGIPICSSHRCPLQCLACLFRLLSYGGI